MALSCSLFSPLSFPGKPKFVVPKNPGPPDRVTRSVLTFSVSVPKDQLVLTSGVISGSPDSGRESSPFFKVFFRSGQKRLRVEKCLDQKTFREIRAKFIHKQTYPQGTHRRKKISNRAKKVVKNFRNPENFGNF
jgi:hypothetical protein